MLQNDPICHKNASRIHQTSIPVVEHLNFLKNLFSAHEKNGRSTPLNSKAVEHTIAYSQKLVNALLHIYTVTVRSNTCTTWLQVKAFARLHEYEPYFISTIKTLLVNSCRHQFNWQPQNVLNAEEEDATTSSGSSQCECVIMCQFDSEWRKPSWFYLSMH
jgi:hypothetical protein